MNECEILQEVYKRRGDYKPITLFNWTDFNNLLGGVADIQSISGDENPFQRIKIQVAEVSAMKLDDKARMRRYDDLYHEFAMALFQYIAHYCR